MTGGMMTSTPLTLLFIPTIYTIIEERGLREKVKADEPIAEGIPEPLQPLGAD